MTVSFNESYITGFAGNFSYATMFLLTDPLSILYK